MLRSTLNPDWSLTAHNARVAASGLRKGFVWWIIGFPIVIGYFAMLFRLSRGKVQAAAKVKAIEAPSPNQVTYTFLEHAG